MSEMSGRPMRKVCANCKNPYIDGDKYCRYCGAKMGKPAFIPDNMACIYGPPPIKRVHKCVKCGYTWTTNQMVDQERYCPKCGGYAPGKAKNRNEAGAFAPQESAPVLKEHLDNVQGYLDNVREYVDNAFARMENEENKEA